MKLCARCVSPENSRPTIYLDGEGVCSGCRYRESYSRVDWPSRYNDLAGLLSEYSARQREKGNPYDCIVPISGGKDSHYQAHIIKNEFGLNPLYVAANHVLNTQVGHKNLRNLVSKIGGDLVRFTINPDAARRIARWSLLSMGDITFHYHSAIMTIPMRMAVQWDVPLVIWGEEGFSQLTGMYQLQDDVEYTRHKTLEHDQRGYDRENLIGKGEGEHRIRESDVEFIRYPTDEEIRRVGVRGIYLGNYLPWDSLNQAKFVHERYDFNLKHRRARTFLTFAKTDDAANDIHTFLGHLKFGYSRGTTDSSEEIRAGRMSREIGLLLAQYLDPQLPPEWDWYMKWLGLGTEQVLSALGSLADGGEDAVRARWERAQTIPKRPFDVQRGGPKGELADVLDFLERGEPYYTCYAGSGWVSWKDNGLWEAL